MKKTIFLIPLFLLLFLEPLVGYKILYKEQLYKLYHLHFYQDPTDCLENIYYLEQALRADFANPLNALAKIETKEEWRHYRILFTMHVNLELVKTYLRLGSKYDKRNAYFFNEPWKETNLKSLSKAKRVYEYARVYWQEAVEAALELPSTYIHLEEIQKWEDEHYRILAGELDYGDIISEQLERVEKVVAEFEAMDENTY